MPYFCSLASLPVHWQKKKTQLEGFLRKLRARRQLKIITLQLHFFYLNSGFFLEIESQFKDANHWNLNIL